MSTPSLQRTLSYVTRMLAEENRDKVHGERPDVDDVTITPSQAEGDRETIERSLGDEGDDNFGREGGGQGQHQPTPSQAEGDREATERNLRKKNSGGRA